MSLGKEHSSIIGRGQGLLIISRAWSGCIGGWCAARGGVTKDLDKSDDLLKTLVVILP